MSFFPGKDPSLGDAPSSDAIDGTTGAPAGEILMIRPVSGAGGTPHEVHKDRLLPERIKKADGPVAKEFMAGFGNPRLGSVAFSLVAERLKGTPTLRYDEPATVRDRELARSKVKDAYKSYRNGDVLVAQNERISDEHLGLAPAGAQHRALAERAFSAKMQRAASVLAVVAALFALMGYYILRNEPEIAKSPRRIAQLCALFVAALGAARLLAIQPWDAELIPVVLAALVLALAYDPQFALMVSFCLCLLTSLALGTGLAHFLVLMGGTAAGVLLLGDVRTRTKPIQVGLAAGVGYFLLTWATGMFQDQPIGLVATQSCWRGAWGLMAGFFLGGSLPFIEKAFGIVTGISLLELGDITHPLLQELVRRAPARTITR